jgi:hypothetical protein
VRARGIWDAEAARGSSTRCRGSGSRILRACRSSGSRSRSTSPRIVPSLRWVWRAARADGRWHVELDEQKTGTDWIGAGSWIGPRRTDCMLSSSTSSRASWRRRTGATTSPGTDKTIQVTLAASEGRDMAIACGKYFDAVMAPEPTLSHADQPQLNVALSVARKRPLQAPAGRGTGKTRRRISLRSLRRLSPCGVPRRTMLSARSGGLRRERR